MSLWIPITAAELNDAKVAKLVDALRTKALAVSQTDPSPRIIASVVGEIRRKIASCKTNQVDADAATIPASLLPLAADLILYRLKNRLEIELTRDEQTNQQLHVETLNRIAACTDVVEQPDDVAAPQTQAAAGTPSIVDRGAELRAKRSGL